MTDEQDRIIGHPPREHGRVLAGPGTGKSTTVLQLAQNLIDQHSIAVRLVTFTRAATAELLEKARTEGHDVPEPTTLHSFALSVLMRNPGLAPLPHPLRIPDEYERSKLIHPDLARRLRRQGFSKATVNTVRALEHEMAAQWESLNPEYAAVRH